MSEKSMPEKSMSENSMSENNVQPTAPQVTTRRTATQLAGAGFMIMNARTALGYQANSALTVGLVGAGNRGSAMTERFFVPNEFAKVTAVCDIYEDKLEAAKKKFTGAKGFRDIKELLADNSIDAVYIATPPVFHPEHFELAVAANKHIFMEKPAGVNVEGCRRVLRAAKKASPNKRISVDFQQRYGKHYNEAFELIKSGELGAVKMIRASWIGGGLPAPNKELKGRDEQIRNWLYFKEMGGDIIVEQQCHNLDVVNWFTGARPVKASGYGTRQIRKDYGNIMDTNAVTFQYEDGRVFSYSGSQVATGMYYDVSETFMCEKGSVRTSRQGYQVFLDNKPGETRKRGEAAKTVTTSYDITKDAIDQFVDGCRNNKIENAAIWAVESTITAIMAREAIYSGKEMSLKQLGWA